MVVVNDELLDGGEDENDEELELDKDKLLDELLMLSLGVFVKKSELSALLSIISLVMLILSVGCSHLVLCRIPPPSTSTLRNSGHGLINVIFSLRTRDKGVVQLRLGNSK